MKLWIVSDRLYFTSNVHRTYGFDCSMCLTVHGVVLAASASLLPKADTSSTFIIISSCSISVSCIGEVIRSV